MSQSSRHISSSDVTSIAVRDRRFWRECSPMDRYLGRNASSVSGRYARWGPPAMAIRPIRASARLPAIRFSFPLKNLPKGAFNGGDLDEFPHFPDEAVDYGWLSLGKDRLFWKAFDRFGDTKEFEAFCERERLWLDDFATFCGYQSDGMGAGPGSNGNLLLNFGFPMRLNRCARRRAHAIRYQKFLQFQFYLQWNELRTMQGERREDHRRHAVLCSGRQY